MIKELFDCQSVRAFKYGSWRIQMWLSIFELQVLKPRSKLHCSSTPRCASISDLSWNCILRPPGGSTINSEWHIFPKLIWCLCKMCALFFVFFFGFNVFHRRDNNVRSTERYRFSSGAGFNFKEGGVVWHEGVQQEAFLPNSLECRKLCGKLQTEQHAVPPIPFGNLPWAFWPNKGQKNFACKTQSGCCCDVKYRGVKMHEVNGCEWFVLCCSKTIFFRLGGRFYRYLLKSCVVFWANRSKFKCFAGVCNKNLGKKISRKKMQFWRRKERKSL